jgi:mannose-6-phosphate isomerase
MAGERVLPVNVQLYPLRFHPLFRRYLWGGRRLASVLHKPIGPDPAAESWEVVDRGPDQSRIAAGPLAGTTLGQLVRDRWTELAGHRPRPGRFPLLVKFLDAHQRLSVQVHPTDEQAARLDPPDLGKTEAWVVLAAEPGSQIYAGLKRGFDRPTLEREVARGTTHLCLHTFEPRVGDCIFVPAGTVHALGSGLLVAEIQQASDTTFRLFDWNRVGPDGHPRELHIPQALDTIDYSRPPVDPQKPSPTDRPHVERLVACDKFVLDRWHVHQPDRVGGNDHFHILVVLQGAVSVDGDESEEPLKAGETMLIPAAVGPASVTPLPSAVILDVYLPILEFGF